MAVVMWFFYPNTRGMPLEEVAQLFGDAEDVAVYQRELAAVGDLSALEDTVIYTSDHLAEEKHQGVHAEVENDGSQRGDTRPATLV